MTILLELEPDLEAQVTAQAQQQGVSVPQYLHGLIAQAVAAPASEALGWPEGFFQETFGALAANPLARPLQGDFEAREALGGGVD